MNSMQSPFSQVPEIENKDKCHNFGNGNEECDLNRHFSLQLGKMPTYKS